MAMNLKKMVGERKVANTREMSNTYTTLRKTGIEETT
jgi:hypothetical protein